MYCYPLIKGLKGLRDCIGLHETPSQIMTTLYVVSLVYGITLCNLVPPDIQGGPN